MLPVPKNTPITLGYRQKPRDPKLAYYIHRGVDFGCPIGTSVVATVTGTVVHAGTGGLGKAFGIHVVLLTEGVYHVYGHLSRADVKRGSIVRQGARLGLSGATGNVSGPHLHYGELTKYSYLADRAPRFLSVTGTVKAVTSIQNMAGNNEQGARTGAARASVYASRRRAIPVDVALFQEATVAAKIRPTLDDKLKGLMTRAGGGEGRYAYLANKNQRIAGGMITAAKTTWYRSDDKQAAWVVWSKDGARAMDVSFHLESDSGAEADAKRVAQMTSIVAQALAIATKYGVPLANILFGGDANSVGMVERAMIAVGWRNFADGAEYEHDPTFIKWDGSGKERFDYAFGHKTASGRVVSIADDHDLSDHAGLRVERTLVA